MRDYVQRRAGRADYDAWLERKVAAARDDMKVGRFHPADDVEAYFAERRARTAAKADEDGV